MLGGLLLILEAVYTIFGHDALTHILGSEFEWCPVKRLSGKSRLWNKMPCHLGLITQQTLLPWKGLCRQRCCLGLW